MKLVELVIPEELENVIKTAVNENGCVFRQRKNTREIPQELTHDELKTLATHFDTIDNNYEYFNEVDWNEFRWLGTELHIQNIGGGIWLYMDIDTYNDIIKDELKKEMEEEVKEELKEELRDKFEDELKAELKSELEDEVREELEDDIREEIREEFESEKEDEE